MSGWVFMRRGPAPAAVAAAVALLINSGSLTGQAPALTPADYGQWERLGSFDLDPTGRWLVSTVTRIDGERELRLRRSDVSEPEIVLEHGRSPLFSADGRWMAYRAGASVEASEDATDPIEDRLGLVDLTTGADSIYFDVRGLAFRDDGPWLAALGVPASDSVGADLVVMNPGSGARTVIGNVSEFAWQDHGRLLAATVKTAWGGTNGVLLFDPSASTLRTIDSRDAEYASLTWQEESTRLAVLRSVESEDREESSHDVLVWDDPTAGPPRILAAMGRADLGEDIRVTPYAGVRFSDDGRTLFVGVRPWEHAEVEATDQTGSTDREDDGLAGAEGDLGGEDAGTVNPDDGIDPADVQVWHWNDDQILRAQEYGAARIARQVMTAAWHTDSDRFVVLSDDLEEPVSIVAGGRWGLVPDYTPYLFGRRFGARTADWYRVDPRDGTRAPIAEQLEFGLQSHADLDRVLVYRDDHWTAVRLSDLSEVVLGDGRDFTQSLADFDFPGPRPPWGVGAWVSGGGKALLYDANDVWVADLSNGRLTQATQGTETNEQFRVVSLDPDQSPFGPALIESESDVMLSVRNLRTKASGYARLAGRGRVDRLLMRDARVTGLAQARSVDRYALRIERWDDSPDVFVGSRSLADLTQVTRTNPFQADYAWGRAELLDYTIEAGLDLQAILVYPANFQPGQQYPLILYQYERLSDNLHVYDAPSRRDYYNYQVWSQQGYFVLMPDIAYEPGRPGPSALDAVEHALDAAVATGHVDPARMGIIGHSWGGYQAAYLPTRTDRFAASVAGAAITNFMSFMGAVHWNGGLPETGHWETGQARMAVPYWEDPAGHLESSPANFITQLRTPMLLMHGDADGVVDFRQGLEFYNYARRAGKEVVLLVYPGADHGLSDESQQVDYHDRILEWFGHFLKGEPAPSWITDGENWTQRAKRIGG